MTYSIIYNLDEITQGVPKPLLDLIDNRTEGRKCLSAGACVEVLEERWRGDSVGFNYPLSFSAGRHRQNDETIVQR